MKFPDAITVISDEVSQDLPVITAFLREFKLPGIELRSFNGRAFKDLTRADLAVAVLIVENGPMVVSHQEHDGIRLPAGNYLIGRQIESAGAEERVVED